MQGDKFCTFLSLFRVHRRHLATSNWIKQPDVGDTKHRKPMKHIYKHVLFYVVGPEIAFFTAAG